MANKQSLDKLSVELRDVLLAEYEKRKLRNNRYSIRSFALQVGCDQSYLQRLFTGKRGISYETFLQFAKKAKIPSASYSNVVKNHNDKRFHELPNILTLKQFKTITSISSSIILNIIRIVPIRQDPERLATLSGFSVSEVNKVIKMALEVEMIEIDKEGYWEHKPGRFDLPTDMDMEAQTIQNEVRIEANALTLDVMKKTSKGELDPKDSHFVATMMTQEADFLSERKRRKVIEIQRKLMNNLATLSLSEGPKKKKQGTFLVTFNIVPVWKEKN